MSPPSFLAEVAPIFQQSCTTCHGPGGVVSYRPLSTYAQITSPINKGTAYSQILDCVMPPSSAPHPLTTDQRHTLLEWFACGAPSDVDAGIPDGMDGGAP